MTWQNLLHVLPALGAIIGVNLLLSGDNALVIALVTRGLPPAERRKGILAGTLGAIVMRIVLTLGVWRLLEQPGLRIAGGVTLLWMAWRLSAHAQDGARQGAPTRLAAAIRQVIWADAVMSADNVLAVAGAAHGDLSLLVIGIATSIPFVAIGSGLISHLLERFPLLLAFGTALLGWVGGELISGDGLLSTLPAGLRSSVAPACAAVLLAQGLRRWRAAPPPLG